MKKLGVAGWILIMCLVVAVAIMVGKCSETEDSTVEADAIERGI